jgi:hypothetical protein
MSIVEKLTEGIVNRNVEKEGHALLEKWEKTGLLEGVDNDRARGSMAVLLENQAKELLREATTMSSGEVEGFASVAFPLVRRVFGNLVANELVSVQPMSLPSGLIFFLDFKHNSTRGGAVAEGSLYGDRVGAEITGGVRLDDVEAAHNVSRQEQGFYNLNQGYASPTGSVSVTPVCVSSGTAGKILTPGGNAVNEQSIHKGTGSAALGSPTYGDLARLTRYDPDCSGSIVAVGSFSASLLTGLNKDALITIKGTTSAGDAGAGRWLRRLTQYDPIVGGTDSIMFVVAATGSEDAQQMASAVASATTITFAQTDSFRAGKNESGLGAVRGGTTAWGLEDEAFIPEIDIRVDSLAVTAVTKKLKAKWTPELGQDLNAYHNLDAEVELTSILSEQIALEIDREILEDLLKGAKAGTYFWSRRPGRFVDRVSGQVITQSTALAGPDFTGTVSEWYETLVETINDVSAVIHRKTVRGGANFIVVGPETANILEFTAGFRADLSNDYEGGSAGAVKTGNLSKKWDVYVDPYFPRNVVLVGRKGASFLESGYVYAPYVPLQVTPTIFGTEDFVPRKGVMTRYGKKMVRPDMYGVVVIEDMLG